MIYFFENVLTKLWMFTSYAWKKACRKQSMEVWDIWNCYTDRWVYIYIYIYIHMCIYNIYTYMCVYICFSFVKVIYSNCYAIYIWSCSGRVVEADFPAASLQASKRELGKSPRFCWWRHMGHRSELLLSGDQTWLAGKWTI